jgi:hypothetical protein
MAIKLSESTDPTRWQRPTVAQLAIFLFATDVLLGKFFTAELL